MRLRTLLWSPAVDAAAGGLHWVDDEQLDGFVATRLPAGPPAPGRPLASAAAGRTDPVLTVVRRAPAGRLRRGRPPRGVVVHLHGYNDYFFAEHLAAAVEDAGWAFLAVDVRRAGRSWRSEEVPHYLDDVREQAADLGAAVAVARGLHPAVPVAVHAHSMGGLVASLWAHAHRVHGGPDALVLNSPFLALGRSWVPRVTDRVLRVLARTAPLTVVSSGPSVYASHLLATNGGRWEFDTTLKRPDGVPVRAGWLAAVLSAQARVSRGLEIGCPVLVGHAAMSGPDRADNPALDEQDTVLDVRAISRRAPGLGRDVTVRSFPGAVHDLALSAQAPRTAYLAAMTRFLDERARR